MHQTRSWPSENSQAQMPDFCYGKAPALQDETAGSQASLGFLVQFRAALNLAFSC
jgi:hypothetical protein